MEFAINFSDGDGEDDNDGDCEEDSDGGREDDSDGDDEQGRARAKDVEGSAKASSARAFLVFPQTSKLSS